MFITFSGTLSNCTNTSAEMWFLVLERDVGVFLKSVLNCLDNSSGTVIPQIRVPRTVIHSRCYLEGTNARSSRKSSVVSVLIVRTI